jgi:hypothetical protein
VGLFFEIENWKFVLRLSPEKRCDPLWSLREPLWNNYSRLLFHRVAQRKLSCTEINIFFKSAIKKSEISDKNPILATVKKIPNHISISL